MMKRAAFLPPAHGALPLPPPPPPRRSLRAPRRAARRAPPVASLPPPPDAATVASFAAHIRGEWTGYEGNFCAASGQPLPVPDYYVPAEFAEWGLRPLGFESNHSITVRGHQLHRKFFRVLPCVSLFADHVDAEEDVRCDTIGHGLTVFADGAFVNGSGALPTARAGKLQRAPRIEFRLPHPHAQRRAALVTLSVDFAAAALAQPVRAVVEAWSCAYCDGADMGGSSGYSEGWVAGAPGCARDLAGAWRRGAALLHRRDGAQHEGGALFLPEGIDVAFERRRDGGRAARAAWRVGGRRVALQRLFDAAGNVVATERFEEERQ